MTSLEISRKYCGELPEWKHLANAKYMDNVRVLLLPGGVWFFPGWPGRPVEKLFRKVDGGWEEVQDAHIDFGGRDQGED